MCSVQERCHTHTQMMRPFMKVTLWDTMSGGTWQGRNISTTVSVSTLHMCLQREDGREGGESLTYRCLGG